MKSFLQYISEDIEVVSDIVRPTEHDWSKVSAPDESSRFKNFGKIHKYYSLHQDSLRNSFVIIHDKSKSVVGEIQNESSEPKTLRVGMFAVHDDHTKKKIGHSLAVAAYKHLHGKHGYTIHSGSEQSPGAVSIWQDLLNDPKTKKHIHATEENPDNFGETKDLGQASKMNPADIWTSGSREVRRKAASKGIRMHKYSSLQAKRAYNTILVLKARKKGKKK